MDHKDHAQAAPTHSGDPETADPLVRDATDRSYLNWLEPYDFKAMDVRSALARGGYRLPDPGTGLRIAFVGQATYFECCALTETSSQLDPAFVDFRAGGDIDRMMSDIRSHRPHVVFVFRPELIPTGQFNELNAVTAGYFTEPLPRPDGNDHPDLGRRLGYLKSFDPANFDRLISFDPEIAPTVERVKRGARVWRSFPLPVADYLYADSRPTNHPPRALFVGRSTKHRERYLGNAKHHYELLHVAHGVSGQELAELFQRYDVSINLHNERYPSFENRVTLSMAAGLLVLSEPLSPTHGLEPGIDYVEVNAPSELDAALFSLKHFPDLYRRIRIMGRMKAEQFRASKVYPRIIEDLLLDLATFGSTRRLDPPRA